MSEYSDFEDDVVDPADDFDTVEEAAEPAHDEPAYAESTSDVEVAATGHPAVDEVLRSLESLGDRPVDEHVAVFEAAHDQLRRTLSGAGDES